MLQFDDGDALKHPNTCYYSELQDSLEMVFQMYNTWIVGMFFHVLRYY